MKIDIFDMCYIKDCYATYKKLKPIYDTYSKKNFKFTKERYYEQHKEEIDAYRNAVRFLKANHGSLEVKKNAFDEEIKKRKASDRKNQEGLESIKTDLQELRQVRFRLCQLIIVCGRSFILQEKKEV